MIKIIEKMLVICLVLVLFVPVASMTLSSEPDAGLMTESTETVALQHIDSAELPQSKPMHRHSFKRAVKRFCLAWIRPRQQLRRAVERIKAGLSPNYDSEGRKRNIESGAQCPSCDVKESTYSPFVVKIAGQPIEAQCVDCALDLQDRLQYQTEQKTQDCATNQCSICHDLRSTEMVCPISEMQSSREVWSLDDEEYYQENMAQSYEKTDLHFMAYADKMRSSPPLSVLIVGIFFGLVTSLIEPSMLSSLAFIGAVRSPTPSELLPLKKAGLTVRRVAKNRNTSCYECRCDLVHDGTTGQPVVMMSRVGYDKKKPHCSACAVLRFTGQPPAPPVPKPAPVPAPAPTPAAPAPAVKEQPKPAPVVEAKGDTAQQLAAMIQTLATGAIDEEAVRKIAQEEDTALMSRVGENIRNEISEAIKALSKPTFITLRKDSKTIELKGIRHFKTQEILFSIVNAKAQNLNLTGEAGTGKTHLLDQIHEALEKSGWFKEMGVKKARSCYIMSANKDMQAPELIGRESPRFFDDGSGRPAGEWDFLPNELLAQFEFGGILGLDEMDRFADSTLSALNAALANGFITTPKGERVMRHPACIIIATGNTKGQGASPKYTAANKQDSATLDRFAGNFIDIDYDPSIEEALCANPELLKAMRNIRRLGDKHQIKGCVVSYRAMMQGRHYVEAGCSVSWFARRFALQFGEENAIKLGHGFDVEFDNSLMGGA